MLVSIAQNDLAAMRLPLAKTLMTSVPFDRTAPDDDADDYQFPAASSSTSLSPSSSAVSPFGSRTERFARKIAEQMPALRYLLVEILHDRRGPPYQFHFISSNSSATLVDGNLPVAALWDPASGMSDGLCRYE